MIGSRRFAARTRLVLPCLFVLIPAAAGAAGPVFWDYPQQVPFEQFALQGVGQDAYGRLAPGLRAEALTPDGPEIVWCLTPDGEGGAWAGTGHDGEVWRFPRDGEPKRVAKLSEPELFSLVRVGKALFVGGGPDGLIFRVAADGAVEPWVDLPEQYVWALAAGADGKLYAAVGSPAAVYRVDGRLSATKLADLPATNAMDIALTAQGRLLVGTQGPGLVWEIDPAGKQEPRVVYESAQEEVRQLIAGPDGAWYALAISNPPGSGGAGESGGLSPGGGEGGEAIVVQPDTSADGPAAGPGSHPVRAPHRGQPVVHGEPGIVVVAAAGPDRAALYRLGADGAVTLAWGGEAAVVAVAYTARWGWVGVGVRDRARSLFALWALAGPGEARPLATWDAGDPVRLIAADGGKDGTSLWVAQARPGRVTRLLDRPAEAAAALAPPIDGKLPIRWGRLRWGGETPDGAQVRFSVRGGPRAMPDKTWSDWSGAWSDADHAIPLPPSRFLQWRVEFSGAGAGARVGEVSVSGFEPNDAPRIMRFAPLTPGEVTLGGQLDDSGNVTEVFPSGLRAEFSAESHRDRRADPLAASRVRSVRVFSWQAGDLNDDRLVYTLAYRRVGDEAWRPIGGETPETVKGWDTAGVPDGLYVLRLTASDKASNPPDLALTAERFSTPILVDNTPPAVAGFTATRAGRGVRVVARVTDAASPLSEAWLELPDGRLVRLDPVDGICDSREESFAAEVAFPAPDGVSAPLPWRVKAGFVDRAGNVARAEADAR